MKRLLCSLVALVLLQGVTGPVKAQPTYSFTTLDVPGSSVPTPTLAYGINNSGQVVGFSIFDATHHYGFQLDNGSYTTLHVPGSTATWAYGINHSGQIVGYYYDAAGFHGFLLDNGSYATLDLPGSVSPQYLAYYATELRPPPLGINNSGPIVGGYSDGSTNHGFLLDHGSYTTLDTPGSTDINDAGQIVGSYTDAGGTHGFLATPVP
jgi:probable HAF family extracellular repeat protein